MPIPFPFHVMIKKSITVVFNKLGFHIGRGFPFYLVLFHNFRYTHLCMREIRSRKGQRVAQDHIASECGGQNPSYTLVI